MACPFNPDEENCLCVCQNCHQEWVNSEKMTIKYIKLSLLFLGDVNVHAPWLCLLQLKTKMTQEKVWAKKILLFKGRFQCHVNGWGINNYYWCKFSGQSNFLSQLYRQKKTTQKQRLNNSTDALLIESSTVRFTQRFIGQ